MILETVEILDNNLSLTLEQLQTKVENGEYDDLLVKYNLLMMISNGLVLINKDDKSCKVIAPVDLENYVKNTDTASTDKLGIVKFNNSFGISVNANGQPFIVKAPQVVIDQRATHGSASYYPIVAENLDYAVRSVYPIIQTELTDPITVNTIYNLGLQTSIDITLPAGQIGDFIQFDFISRDTATILNVTSDNELIGEDLIPEVNKLYSLCFDWGIIGYTDGAEDPINYGWRFSYSEYELSSI